MIIILVELRAENVEAHEARHAIESPTPRLPSFLLSWDNAGFADQINKELRAYLGELHDSPREPCLSLLALVHAGFSPTARPTPTPLPDRFSRAVWRGTIVQSNVQTAMTIKLPTGRPILSPSPFQRSIRSHACWPLAQWT